jgi:uncharacterized metal-binding protein
MDKVPGCAACGFSRAQKACRVQGGKAPDFCPTKEMTDIVEKVKERYAEPDILEFARQASIQESECYINREAKPFVLHPVKPRLQEICEFAERMGYKRLGLAYCAGLQSEAGILTKVLKSWGFEIMSVVCKVGCIPKEDIGLSDPQKVQIGSFEPMCNPLTQAEVLNEAKTDFNIMMGLCVGHDSLFFMNAKAPTTVFAVKDRVSGHNPMAALYTLGSYSARFLRPKS